MHFPLALFVAALVATTAPAQAEQRQLLRADGSTNHYAVDVPNGTPAGTVVIIQGSGCLPTTRNQNLSIIRGAFPNHVAVTVEKYGIEPDAPVKDGFSDCPSSFHAGFTVSQRVDDYQAVLAALDAPRPLVLFGGSEGGLVVAMLSGRVEPEASIVLSSATGISFVDMVLSTIPPEGQEPVRAGLAAAAADPDGTALFAGSSHRFWADIMRHVPADYMLAATGPFLVIQGGLDTSSPLAAARATADRFAAARRCDLTYWEFPGLDHGMADPAGSSHLASIAKAAASWAAQPLRC
jgi:pimeloyl-ACP methyl ester carboxylesterase